MADFPGSASPTVSNGNSDEKSQRTTHVIGAFFVATILMTLLFLAPTCGRFYHGRQVQAIQVGALADLKLVADSEAAFFEKHKSYTTDLKSLGIFPKNVVYKFGFVKASDASLVSLADHDPSRKDLDALKAAEPRAKIGYSPVTKLDQIDFAKLVSYCPDCTATQTTFKAIAAANLDDDAVLDIWTIDEKGNSLHLVDDLSQ